MILKTICDWRRRRAAARVEEATKTLKALASGGADYYARSVARLFLDGGSERGFQTCVKLGWAQYVAPPGMGRERFGRLTPTGRLLAARHVNGVVTIDAKAA